MKLNKGGIDIFNNQKFITRGVAENIPIPLQLLMWEMIHNLPVDKDYLQVFKCGCCEGKQSVEHIQEEPEYKTRYLFNADTIFIGKIFVIDDGSFSLYSKNPLWLQRA